MHSISDAEAARLAITQQMSFADLFAERLRQALELSQEREIGVVGSESFFEVGRL